ncbi:MAG: methionine--tRNA ligase [Bacillota bacterium]
MKKPYYITTPIYYASGAPHIGHAYCTIATDAAARFKRYIGHDVYFLTGTDEHGQKIERKAEAVGKSPQQFVDDIVDLFKELWVKLDISNDDFIRTTEDRHKVIVQKIFKQLYEQGDIYKSEYEGLYCVDCEAFWTERQLKDGNCPDCGRPVNLVKEESYFFRASKYADRLMKYIEDNPEFIQPVSRKNEMVNNFLKPGLADICVSRTSFKWGIPVSFDPKHVVYVWIDALSNYITALGYGTGHDQLYRKFWPADVHVVGKEIVRFHTIIWPIILMALDLPLPKQVFGHGWLLSGGDKMSKSKGNVVDPNALIAEYGSDTLRYYLLSQVPFGQDGIFTDELFIQTANTDLANDLGNLLSRTVAMIERYFGGEVPAPSTPGEFDDQLKSMAQALPQEVEKDVDKLAFSDALAAIWALVKRSNKYIDETSPWVLAKDPEQKGRLGTVLYNLAESLRIIGGLLSAFLPKTSPRLFAQLGIADQPELQTWEAVQQFGLLPVGTGVVKGEALFPRIDTSKEQPAAKGDAPAKKPTQPQTKEEKTVTEEIKQPAALAVESQPAPAPVVNENPLGLKPQITIDDFAKIDLRVAKVLAAERVEKADKLLKLTLEVGPTQRTIVAGIAQHYTPEEMVGKTIVVVANLAPAKIRGIESNGMLLAASFDDKSKVVVLSPEKEMETGARVR